ncbi:MAG TPA: histidine phosphatase family protein [Azospirillaceae bacterium]|nr:histidine phosphatase family protein [Azospirillaceae bacterium]
MKTLLLLRHAKAEPGMPGQNDHDRALAPRGERNAGTMADYIAERKPAPDLILCSSAARTRATLAPLLARLGGPAPKVEYERILYLCGEEALLDRLRKVPETARTVLLVAHNPDLQQLTLGLAGKGPPEWMADVRTKFPTGALARIELGDAPWSTLTWGMGTLTDLAKPRELGED